jgi:hypothetical protein
MDILLKRVTTSEEEPGLSGSIYREGIVVIEMTAPWVSLPLRTSQWDMM